MSFTSLVFGLFLPAVFAVYWLVGGIDPGDGRARRWLQNLVVVVASYVFYGWWEWRFLVLILFTSVWSFLSGLVLERCRHGGGRKWIVALALLVNLGLLGVFKYANFFIESFKAAFPSSGWTTLNLILPVGISFYTFQALGYVIDVYRRDIRATRDPVVFLAFVSFFPQLVAGPIERATNLLPQFERSRRFDYALAVDGCRQMLWGFFKKLVVADGCAFAANALLADGNASSVSRFVGLLCFTLQIYGDFSGYSDIAIGISKTFGIRLCRNFAFPYFSRNIGEFWRRWHMSLTTWFKDYLYIPLGGSRCGRARTIRNTFVVFLVSGFWHGANWTFVIWGLVHALAFLPSLVTGSNRRYAKTALAEGRWLPSCGDAVRMAGTFLLVLFAWAFFRAGTLSEAVRWLTDVACAFDFRLDPLRSTGALRSLFWALVMLLVEWFNRRGEHGLSRCPGGRWLRFAVYVGVMTAIVFNLSPRQAFIYFQF